MHPYSSTDTVWKKSLFIVLERSDFNIVDNLLIAIDAFAMRMVTSISIDEILLLRYVKRSTNFRDLHLEVKMGPSISKRMNFVLFAYMLRSMLPAACSNLFSRDSACAGVFMRSIRSSA